MSTHFTPTREEIKNAVDQLVNFVKPTYGPKGNKVIITDSNRLVVLDDGAAISDEFHLDDKFLDAIISLVKGVTRSVNRRLGDGNTGSLLFLQALLSKEADRKELLHVLEQVKEFIKQHVVQIKSKDHLKEVALMAYNDLKAADMVAEIVYKLGAEGVISLEESSNSETTYEIIEGLQFDKGFISPYMETDTELKKAVLHDVPILVTEKKIENVSQLNDVVSYLMKKEVFNLVLIADDFDNDTVEALVENKRMGKFNVLAIKSPSFGERRRNILEKIAKITEAKLVGREVRELTSVDLGMVKKIVSTIDQTTITQGVVESGKDYGIGVIKVGGATREEMVSTKYKIDNAINSAKLAMRDGVVPGGGETLCKIKTDSEVMNEALRTPIKVLHENGGELTEVWDAVAVTLGSLSCAVSIALLLNETKGIIVKNA